MRQPFRRPRRLPLAPRALLPLALATLGAAPARAQDVRVCAGGDVTLGTNLPRIVERALTPREAARRERRLAMLRDSLARLGVVDSTFALLAPPPLDTIPAARVPRPTRLLAPLRPVLAGSDVVLLNVEGAIGEGPADSKCGPRSTQCFAFRMPGSAAPALRAVAGTHAVVVGNVANNHARDAGAAGLDSTVARLERAGVVVAGADTLASVAVTARGDTVAFLGFATSGPGTPDVRYLDAVRRHVARAAERWPRLVVTMHMGAEGAAAQRTRDSVERYVGMSRGNPVAFARAAVEAGADLVVGHGPHVLRAIEWQGDVPVAYSLGNLVTYGEFSNREPINRGAVLCASLDADGRARKLVLRPTVQHGAGWVARDKSRRALVLVDSLSRLDFPRSGARVKRDGTVTRPRRASAPKVVTRRDR